MILNNHYVTLAILTLKHANFYLTILLKHEKF